MQSIASGSYGEIFSAEDLHSHGPKHQRVAVKFDGGFFNLTIGIIEKHIHCSLSRQSFAL